MKKIVSFAVIICALLTIQTLGFAFFGELGYDSPILNNYYVNTNCETLDEDYTPSDIYHHNISDSLYQHQNKSPKTYQRGFSSLHSDQEIDSYIIATSLTKTCELSQPCIIEQVASESSSESFNDANSHLLLSFEQNANISSQLPVPKASKIDVRTSSSFYELGYDSPALSCDPNYIATLTRSELSDSSDDNFEIARGIEIYCSFSSSENSELGHSPKSPQTV